MANLTGPNIGYVRDEVNNQSAEWETTEDASNGELAVKAKGEKYLPKHEYYPNDPKLNNKVYEKYLLRAVFFPVTGRTLSGLCGQVFSKPVQTDLPAILQNLEDNLDGAGLTLEQHTKTALTQVLKKGRCGLLADFPRVPPDAVTTKKDISSGALRPRVLHYTAEQIINWREQTIGGETKLSKLVLYENKVVDDDGFEFSVEPRWRVYELTDDGVQVTVYRKEEADSQGQIEYVVDEETVTVLGSDQAPLKEIPFAFIGAENNDSSVDGSPIYPIAQLNIAHYRNSAAYEQSVDLVGQVTPVLSGITDDWAKKHINGKVTFGALTPLLLPVGAKAELLQAQPSSMSKEAMDEKEEQMKAIGAKLIEPQTVQRTATETEIEETSEASVLSSVAKNVSAAYELALYYCSLFLSPVEKGAIKVQLNSEFQIVGLDAQERKEVVEAWQSGLITKEEAREVYRRKGVATENNEDAFTKISQEGVT